jgi:hypothetical protein
MVLYICLMYEKLNAFRNVPHERIRAVALGDYIECVRRYSY